MLFILTTGDLSVVLRIIGVNGSESSKLLCLSSVISWEECGGKGLGWALICRLCRFSWCKYSHHCRSQATRAKSLNQVEETRHNVAQSVISWTPNRLQPGTGGKRKSTSWSCGSQPQLSRIITQEFWRILMPRSHPKPMRSDSLGWDPGMCVVRTLPQPQSRSTGWHRACLVLSFAKFQPILSRHHIFLH